MSQPEQPFYPPWEGDRPSPQYWPPPVDPQAPLDYPEDPPSPPPFPPPGYPPQYPGGFGGYPGALGPPDPYDPYRVNRPPGTNGLATGSLVTSIVGLVLGIPLTLLCFVGWVIPIVGIVLGIVALSQIKQTQQEGRGLAIAGIAIGAPALVLGIAFIVFVLIAARA